MNKPQFNIKIKKNPPQKAPKNPINPKEKINKIGPQIPTPYVHLKPYAGQNGALLIELPTHVTYQSNLRVIHKNDKIIIEIVSNSGVNSSTLDITQATVLYKALKQFIQEKKNGKI